MAKNEYLYDVLNLSEIRKIINDPKTTIGPSVPITLDNKDKKKKVKDGPKSV